MPFLSFSRRRQSTASTLSNLPERKKSTAPTIPSLPPTKTQTTPSPPTPPNEPTATLLTLPLEIQHMIYAYIFTPWSLAILGPDESTLYNLDSTYTLHPSPSTRLISGPPGLSLLLVSRQLYTYTSALYGQDFTGTLLLGKISGKLMRRSLPKYLSNHVLSRFYPSIHTITLSFSLDTGRFAMNLRTLFPNLRTVRCTAYEGAYGPIVRFGRTQRSFLTGICDDELVAMTRPIVYQFVSSERRAVEMVGWGKCPWDQRDCVLDVRLVGSMVKLGDTVVGFNYRWEGPDIKVVARVARKPTYTRYWDESVTGEEPALIQSSEEKVTGEFGWVQPRRR